MTGTLGASVDPVTPANEPAGVTYAGRGAVVK
jgi:hypothetical protein